MHSAHHFVNLYDILPNHFFSRLMFLSPYLSTLAFVGLSHKSEKCINCASIH